MRKLESVPEKECPEKDLTGMDFMEEWLGTLALKSKKHGSMTHICKISHEQTKNVLKQYPMD